MPALRILFIASRIPREPFDGGMYATYHTIRSLTQAGHFVTCAFTNTKRHHGLVSDVSSVCSHAIAVDVDTRISATGAVKSLLFSRVAQQAALPRAPYFVHRYLSEDLVNQIEKLNIGEFDVIHADSLPSVWYACALRERNRTHCPPIVYRAHNIEHRIHDHLSKDKQQSVFSRFYRRLTAKQLERFEKAVAEVVNAVVTISPVDAAWFEMVGAKAKIYSVPTGMDVSDFPLQDHKQYRIGMIGSLEWAPNIEGLQWFVQHVLPIIWESEPRTELHIAGRSPVDAIQKLHDGVRVFVHGPVPDATQFLSTLSVEIVPLLSGSGIRIKILEGLAHKVPIVSTGIGAEGLNVVNNEHLLLADSARDFASAVIRLLHNKSEAERLANNGYALVLQQYSWPALTQRLIEVYRSVIC